MYKHKHYDFYVYIMSSNSGVLYVGITNNLVRRVFEHKNKINRCFTSRYQVNRLVYYEHYTDVRQAISREKEIKKWRREKKISLIVSFNARWKDLGRDFFKG